jgi:5'-3' exonuclease
VSKIKVVTRPADADGVLVVDVSHLVHRSLYAYKELTTKDGKPSGHIFGSVRLLLATLANQLDPGKWCIALGYDGPGAKAARREILPTYKANRDDGRFNPVPDAMPILKAVPGVHIIQPGKEGDDAVAWMAERCSNRQVVVLSGDKDLWGLKRMPHVSVFSPSLKRYVMEQDIQKEYHTTDPSKIYLAKALFGDASDGIKGVKGLLKKQVAPTLNRPDVKDTADFYHQITRANLDDVSDNTLKKLAEYEQDVHTNFKVLQPRTDGFDRTNVTVTGQSDADREILEGHLRRYSCNALIDMLGPLYP